jgi:hypothetical protein
MHPFLLVASTAFTGCSSVLGIDSDRHLVVDSGSGEGSWECLAAPLPTPPRSATLYLLMSDPSMSVNMSQPQGTPVPGLTVTACARLDAACSAPLVTSAPTDASGRATIMVPGGFDGYFQTLGNATYMPALYTHEPILGDQLLSQVVMRPNLLSLAAKIAGATLDPSEGSVIVYLLDCNSTRAAGATFDAGPSVRLFYLNQSLPSPTATETDSTGSGFAPNVPAGVITVTATNAAGVLIASTTTFVRAGQVTFIELRPSQATYATGP